MTLKRKHRLLIALVSGVLLWLPWTEFSLGWILFFAFVPLLFLEDHICEHHHKARRVLGNTYIAFFIWSLLSLWWIYNAAFIGAAAAVVIGGFFITIPFYLFHLVKRKLGRRIGYYSLVFFFVGFEYIYLNSELSFPWINLGNGFARNIIFIQWYEYTGTLGGTLWVMISNILLFQIIKKYLNVRSFRKIIAPLGFRVGIIILPIIISIILFHTYEEKGETYNVVVIQPNIDPYADKYEGLTPMEQLEIILKLAEEKTSTQTDYIVAPESAIDYPSMWIKTNRKTGKTYLSRYPDKIDTVNEIRIMLLQQFIAKYPKTKFITGVSTRREFEKGEPLTPTHRKDGKQIGRAHV